MSLWELTELRQRHDLPLKMEAQQQQIQGPGGATCIIAIQRESAPIARISYLGAVGKWRGQEICATSFFLPGCTPKWVSHLFFFFKAMWCCTINSTDLQGLRRMGVN